VRKLQQPLLATRIIIVGVEIHQSVGCTAQKYFASISTSSNLDVISTIADRRYSPSLAIAGVMAPEVDIAISCATQILTTLISSPVDNDVVKTATDVL